MDTNILMESGTNELEVLGNGKQAKPYLYVQDLIDAILFIYQNLLKKLVTILSLTLTMRCV